MSGRTTYSFWLLQTNQPLLSLKISPWPASQQLNRRTRYLFKIECLGTGRSRSFRHLELQLRRKEPMTLIRSSIRYCCHPDAYKSSIDRHGVDWITPVLKQKETEAGASWHLGASLNELRDRKSRNQVKESLDQGRWFASTTTSICWEATNSMIFRNHVWGDDLFQDRGPSASTTSLLLNTLAWSKRAHQPKTINTGNDFQ